VGVPTKENWPHYDKLPNANVFTPDAKHVCLLADRFKEYVVDIYIYIYRHGSTRVFFSPMSIIIRFGHHHNDKHDDDGCLFMLNLIRYPL
jgi:hypothetical protein